VTEAKTLSETYTDRNLLAVGFAVLAEQYPDQQIRGCWCVPDADDADADRWAVIYAWVPAGQISWHVPRSLAEDSGLPRKNVAWDGHSRDVKNERLRSFGESTEN
jgi:hypothetical protein